MKKLFSWNVNGIRAWQNKGMVQWLKEVSPDALAIQETKAMKEQLDTGLLEVDGYHSYFMSAARKGYSGVALYSKEEPVSIETCGDSRFDDEGRVLIAHYSSYTLVNCYFPNSQPEGRRLDYKLAFCDHILSKCNDLVSSGRTVVLCGDYNIAHTEIDLKNPKRNEQNPGFLPEERQWMTGFLGSGYIDTFRRFHPDEPGHYTWWSYRFNARAKDIGWRIDYFCVNSAASDLVSGAEIHKDVMGSDHCPVSITINV